MESNEVNSSFFPPPPPRHKLFTNHNLSLARQLLDKDPINYPNQPFDPSKQQQILQQQQQQELNDHHEPFDLRTLIIPPNLDWIQLNGGWTAFGDFEPWPGNTQQASLEGMPKLYDSSMERKQALQCLLNTLIHSYLQLLDVLANQGPVSLSSPNRSTTSTSKTDQIVSHIELAAFNIHGLCNELRPRQARETLKLMLRQQALEKRKNAVQILATCQDLRNQLATLKTLPPELLSPPPHPSSSSNKHEEDKEEILRIAEPSNS